MNNIKIVIFNKTILIISRMWTKLKILQNKIVRKYQKMILTFKKIILKNIILKK